MPITERTRPLDELEIRLLKKMKAGAEKALGAKLRVHYYIMAIVVGAACTWLAVWTQWDVLKFVFGTLAVFGWGFVVFAPYEVYKDRKALKHRVAQVDGWLQKNKVHTRYVKALQIAIAPEYDDEGDLYLVEYEPGHILYLWDEYWNLQRRMPCLEFELYEDTFAKLTGYEVYTHSPRIEVTEINPRLKWAYMSDPGAPEHLSTEQIGFDELIARINSAEVKELH